MLNICPPHSSFIYTRGGCRCDDGYFRVRGKMICMPNSRMRVVNETVTTQETIRGGLATTQAVTEIIEYLEGHWFCFCLIIAVVMVAVCYARKVNKGFSRLSPNKEVSESC